ncbi:MAG: C10 family peptidase [Muribaculaceae bacterium]
MKKFLLISSVIALGATTATARTLSPDEALSRLNEGRSAKAVSKAGTATKLIKTGTLNNTPTYYIFNQGSRTIFVGADDLAEPLLGYVDNPEFNVDDMPPAMKWWLSEYSREIEYASSNQAKGIRVKDVRARVELPGKVSAAERTATRTAISPLCATGWDQGAPYNNLCPTKNGTRTYTGCVATAMAQVMKYHSYPSKGIGSNSYTWSGGNQTLSMNFANITFDWSNMLDKYASASSGTSAQRTAIATLMKACGYAVDMEYGVDSDGGSGATSFAIAPALVENFGYDNATHTEFRDYYSTEAWEEMIYDNLKNVGPVVYCGVANGGGHCFVCDGYNTSGYFHINWGWSNSYDGYFKLNALNPDGQGAGGYSGGYNTQQDATLGIRKPVSGSVKPTGYLAVEGTLTCSASSKKLTFKATNGGFYNMGSYAASFTVGLALTNASGSTQYVGSTSLGTVNPGYGTASLALTIPTSVTNGSYKASLVYKVGSGSWQPFKTHYGSNDYYNVTVGSSSVTVGSAGCSTGSGSSSDSSTDSGEVSVSALSCTPTSPVIGESVSVKATFKNTYTSSQTVSASAYLCTKGTSNYSVAATIGSAQSVTISGSATKSVTYSGTIDSSLSAGTYYLVIANSDGYIISDIKEVSVVAASSGSTTDEGSFGVSALTVSPTSPVIGEAVSMKATFKNTYTSTKSTAAKAYICTKSSSSYSIKATIGSEQTVSVTQNSTKSVTFSGTVPSSLTAGTYYALIADGDNNIISDVKTITIVEPSSSSTDGEITVTSATSSTGFTAGAACKVSAVVKNTYSTSQSVTVKAYLCTKSSSSYSIAATIGSASVTVSQNATKTATISGTLDADIAAGTYYLVITDGDNYILNTPEQVTVSAASSDTTTGSSKLSISSVTTSTGFTLGATCTLKVTFKNTTAASVTTKVKPKFFDANGNLVDWLASKSVTVSKNGTKTITFSNKLYDTYPAGTYYLQFIDNDGNGYVVGNKTYSVTINGSSSSKNSSRYNVKSFTMSDVHSVDADNARFDIEVEAVEEDCNEQFVALIFPESLFDVDQIAIAVFDRKSIAKGDTESMTFFGSLENLVPGNNYRASLFTLDADSFFTGLDYVDTINFRVSATDGIEDVIADEAQEEAAYFDLKGVRVDAENLVPGVYVKIANGKAQKVVIK